MKASFLKLSVVSLLAISQSFATFLLPENKRDKREIPNNSMSTAWQSKKVGGILAKSDNLDRPDQSYDESELSIRPYLFYSDDKLGVSVDYQKVNRDNNGRFDKSTIDQYAINSAFRVTPVLAINYGHSKSKYSYGPTDDLESIDLSSNEIGFSLKSQKKYYMGLSAQTVKRNSNFQAGVVVPKNAVYETVDYQMNFGLDNFQGSLEGESVELSVIHYPTQKGSVERNFLILDGLVTRGSNQYQMLVSYAFDNKEDNLLNKRTQVEFKVEHLLSDSVYITPGLQYLAAKGPSNNAYGPEIVLGLRQGKHFEGSIGLGLTSHNSIFNKNTIEQNFIGNIGFFF
jgi:hypothetical protein